MAPGRGIGGEDEEVRALLREALRRISDLERRYGQVDLARLVSLDLQVYRRRETLSRMKTFLAHAFSLHTLLVLLGIASTATAQIPQLAAWHMVLMSLGVALGGAGFAKACAADPSGGKPPSGPTVILPLLFLLSAGALSGCAGAAVWGKCTLGDLPQAAQPALPQATQALEQEDGQAAIAALETIGFGLLPGQIACIVKAIAADEAAKVPKTYMRSRASINIVRNAMDFLAKHPAMACAEPSRVSL